MLKQEVCVLWMNEDEARLFEVSEERMKREFFKANKEAEKESFWNEIISHMASPTRLLILGPDQSKDQFKNFLLATKPSLEKSLVGAWSAPYATDQLISEYATSLWKPGQFVAT